MTSLAPVKKKRRTVPLGAIPASMQAVVQLIDSATQGKAPWDRWPRNVGTVCNSKKDCDGACGTRGGDAGESKDECGGAVKTSPFRSILLDGLYNTEFLALICRENRTRLFAWFAGDKDPIDAWQAGDSFLSGRNARTTEASSGEHVPATLPRRAAPCRGAGLYLRGGENARFDLYETDVVSCNFRQEHMFRWLMGVNEPDCVAVLDLQRQEAILFVPVIEESDEVWHGARRSCSWYCSTYDVDACHELPELQKVLEKRGISVLYTVDGSNTDSGNDFMMVPEDPAYVVHTARKSSSDEGTGEDQAQSSDAPAAGVISNGVLPLSRFLRAAASAGNDEEKATLSPDIDAAAVQRALHRDAIVASTGREAKHPDLPSGYVVLSGQQTTTTLWSGKTHSELWRPAGSGFWYEVDTAWQVLCELRLRKSPNETLLLRMANLLSSQAHSYVMRKARVGQREVQLEALFKGFSYYYGGARHQAYECICCSGANGAVLHYGHAGRPNDKVLAKEDLLLLDMGSEYQGYCTDITRSYPACGKFTAEQAAIVELVSRAQQAVFRLAAPGTSWVHLHEVSERVILRGLLRLGVLRPVGDGEFKRQGQPGLDVRVGTQEQEDACVAAMQEAGMCGIFMPHGLGHLIGLAVHDVGGYPEHAPKRPTRMSARKLRTARVLQVGMVLSVEPGCYFNDYSLRVLRRTPELSRYVDNESLERYAKHVGGVRLEDNMVVVAGGNVNMTVVPVDVDEIERIMGVGHQQI